MSETIPDQEIPTDIEGSTELKSAIEKWPKFRAQILKFTELYCDPRLHNCTFEGDEVFYQDPQSGERRQLRRFSETTLDRGGGSSRVVFEGPTPGTVIKFKPGGFDAQTDEELAMYVDATPDDKKRLVTILGFRAITVDNASKQEATYPSGQYRQNIVLLEEKVEPIRAGERRVESFEIPWDIDMIKRRPDRHGDDWIKERYAVHNLAELEELQRVTEWGKGFGLQDAGLGNVGRTEDGRLVFHDFGTKRHTQPAAFLVDPNHPWIDFEAIRTQAFKD